MGRREEGWGGDSNDEGTAWTEVGQTYHSVSE